MMVAADYRRFLSEDLSPSLSPQEKGTDLDSIGILVGTRRKSLALRRGIYLPGSKAGGEVKIFFPQMSADIYRSTSLLASLLRRKGQIQILLAFWVGHGESPSS
jgi:hypothetical protein